MARRRNPTPPAASSPCSTSSSSKLQLHHQHPWDLTPREARELQGRLAPLVEASGGPARVERIAGIDLGYERERGLARAAVVVLDFPSLEVAEEVLLSRPVSFPYVPGLLSFREVPAALDALERLRVLPDLIVCDGQGLAHPRRFGLACHLGLLTGIPTLGAAKSRLVGEHGEPPRERGGEAPLLLEGEVVGSVLRTRTGVAPLYVSAGHRIGLAESVRWVLAISPRYRLPETTRRAHALASRKG